MGCKIHSMLLKSCITEEHESYKKIVRLFGWITGKKAEIEASSHANKVSSRF